MHRRPWLCVISLAGMLVVPLPAAGQTRLPFGDGKWELKGPGGAVQMIDGRETLGIETGWAYRRDVVLQDGTIEFDIQVTRRRSFAYLTFRMADDNEMEEIYLRPHKSGLPDAVQYAPVFQGQSGWQLYHGPGATAAIPFEPGAWTRVRLVLKGSQAALFVGDLSKPALVIPRLVRPPAPGYIALRGFAPDSVGGPGHGPVVRYSNVEVRPDHIPFDFSGVKTPDPPVSGAIAEWQVSRSFVPSKDDDASVRQGLFDSGAQIVRADAGGLANLHRHVKLPADSRAAGAAARVRIRADQAGVRRFDLGFSDIVTVFLNGQPLYRGDAHYSFDAPRQEGLITYDQAALYLPLVAGDNELVIVVTDSFGGWGLQGRFRDMRGLAIEAR